MKLPKMPWLALVPVLALAQKAPSDHWVATWATAQLLAHASAPRPNEGTGFNNQTVRMVVHTSIGGERLRIKLENAFGSTPLVIGAAHVALRAKESASVEGSDRAVSFSGQPSVTLQPGMLILSDPVDLHLAPLSDLLVSLYFPNPTGPPTMHAVGLHNTYVIKEGDSTSAPSLTNPTVMRSLYYLAAVDVAAPPNTVAVVAFGDSITDGAVSTNETNHSWPALLAARLAGSKKTANVAVVNLGISGNRVLHDGSGISAVARFDRDVLSQSGARWLMLLEGINDIGHAFTAPGETLAADDLIAAYRQIVALAHTHGIRVIGCTLTPYERAGYYREGGEAVREAVNEWIRSGGAFDAVVDFDKATRDSADPKRFRAEFDPGDHLHPNDAGYQAMADAVDLTIFTRKGSK